MKTCSNCGKELNDNISFCPACGTALSEQRVNQEKKTLPYIDEILSRHLEHFHNEEGKEVETRIVISSDLHIYECKILSERDNPLRIEVSFKDSNNKEREAYVRFKKTQFSNHFNKNLMQTDGYSGYIDLSNQNDYAKEILSTLIADVYQKTDNKLIGYNVSVGGESLETYDIQEGVHVKKEFKKGCMSVVLALVVLGATLISFF